MDQAPPTPIIKLQAVNHHNSWLLRAATGHRPGQSQQELSTKPPWPLALGHTPRKYYANSGTEHFLEILPNLPLWEHIPAIQFSPTRLPSEHQKTPNQLDTKQNLSLKVKIFIPKTQETL